MSATPSTVLRRSRRSVVRLASAVALMALLTGCSLREAYENSLSFGFPKPITDRGESIYELWLGSVAAAAVVGIFVWALIAVAVVRYRRVSDELPRQVRYNLPIEVLYTFIPFVIVAVLFYYTVVSQNVVNELRDEPGEGQPDVTIAITGFQWNWTFRHHRNTVDSPVLAEVTGEPERRATLVLPTDRVIRFTQESPDVIHSFWVPDFLFKRDVVPGRVNTFELTIKKPGTYIGRCAEFCGERHSRMNFNVKVVSPQEYDAYLQQAQDDSGAGLGSNRTNPTGSPS